MSEDFFREADVRPFKYKKPEENPQQGVRLYCTQKFDDPKYALQLRGRIRLGGSAGLGREGKDFIIAHAVLDLDDMRALRDAINEVLVSHEIEQDPEAASARMRESLQDVATILQLKRSVWDPLQHVRSSLATIASTMDRVDRELASAIEGSGGPKDAR